ncbi:MULTISPECIES: IS200/IS605 family transposase [unclassified Pseudoalteromonas]|uniref:IS200/IS605 family transposase n=1 Tax=Pseudoalteromonas sp. TAE80 TaxID=1938598 RepID=UPI00097864E9
MTLRWTPLVEILARLVLRLPPRPLSDLVHEQLQYKRLLKSWDCELLECNGEPDHLHLLISANPKMQPSKMVNSLKTATSRLVRKEFSEHLGEFYWKPVFYSRSYCLVSCGGVPLEIVKQYLAQQEGFD